MSSYLLLRNNQESGPFAIEELKGMSLKAYDLIWIVGKSAAWRYPGEIIELKSFAPSVPEQNSDAFIRKPDSDISSPDSANNKKPEAATARSKENNSPRVASRSVYVNLPAEKKQPVSPPARILYDADLSVSARTEPDYDFSDLYRKRPNPTVRFTSKVLWISTVLLLFGTGILTGFFISDRRKIFSTDENHPQGLPAVHPTGLNNKKETSAVPLLSAQHTLTMETASGKLDAGKPVSPGSSKAAGSTGKKNTKNMAAKKDSLAIQATSYSAVNLVDTARQNSVSKTDILYQNIKAHPENYINLVTGRYSTGMFGGISSFPMTVTNNSPVVFDLVVVTVEYIQNNGKVFKTERLSFNDLQPGETVTMKAPKSSRGVKIASRINTVGSRQLDLNYSN
jgi:hypothetical protein